MYDNEKLNNLNNKQIKAVIQVIRNQLNNEYKINNETKETFFKIFKNGIDLYKHDWDLLQIKELELKTNGDW